MRARFSAFYLNNARFLLDTLHPSRHQVNELVTIEQSLAATQWLSLNVLLAQNEEVEFVAFYKAEPVAQLHERSRFCYENKLWFYLDGDQLPPIKLNRNEACPCGRGLKFKKCCLRA